MKVILTSDVELWSWNRNFEQDVKKGFLKLIDLAENEKIPITFFISLSDKGYGDTKYLEKIYSILRGVKSKYIFFGVHTHCKNLPLDINSFSDNLKEYNKEDITKILIWYKKELESVVKKKIISHRAGGYNIPDLNTLDECFKKAGLKIDSSDISREYSKILRLKNFIEIPPTTNKEYSQKLRVFSPEQMSFEELSNFYEEAKKYTEILVINFHSFSVFGDLGKKARLWYKLPNPLRILLKPLVNILKQFNTKNLENMEKENKTTKKFENLIKLIKLLKEDGSYFINLKKIK